MLVAKNISFSYLDESTLQNISFSVKKGTHLAIIGESGCGKSTLLKLIYGLYDLDEGQIFWKHTEVLGPKFHLIPGMPFMKYLAQDFDLMPFITVAENVGKYLSNFYPEEKQSRIKELLEVVELTPVANIKVKELSGGQKQRFSIATTLINKPILIFLDEPTTGLDPQARRNLWDLIRSIRDSGTTVVITTHYMDEAEILCDRVAIVDSGELIALNSPDQLIDDLVAGGFEKPKEVKQANLEEVFISLTGHALREA